MVLDTTFFSKQIAYFVCKNGFKCIIQLCYNVCMFFQRVKINSRFPTLLMNVRIRSNRSSEKAWLLTTTLVILSSFLSSLLNTEWRRKGEWTAKIVIKRHAFLLDRFNIRKEKGDVPFKFSCSFPWSKTLTMKAYFKFIFQLEKIQLFYLIFLTINHIQITAFTIKV